MFERFFHKIVITELLDYKDKDIFAGAIGSDILELLGATNSKKFLKHNCPPRLICAFHVPPS